MSFYCDYCGGDFDDESQCVDIQLDGNDFTVCKECHENNNFWVCHECGDLYAVCVDDQYAVLTDVGEQVNYCHACWEHQSVVYCGQCGRWFDSYYCGASRDGSNLCPDCMDDGYGICSECGRIDYLDCDNHCSNCQEQEDSGQIHDDTSWAPDLEFRKTEDDPDDEVHLGFELEVDCVDGIGHDPSYEVATEVSDEGYTWCSCDGSLSYDGFEIKSHPMTLLYHKKHDWRDMLNNLRSHGYRSYDNRNCGVHIHADRNALPNDSWVDMSDWLNEPEPRKMVIKVSQRKSTYATFYDDECHNRDEGRAAIINGQRRYAVMNFQNGSTIEFRSFKGTLKYSTFISYLEFVDSLIHYWKESPSVHCMAGYLHFVERQPERYKALVDRLKSKGFTAEVYDGQLSLPFEG